MIYVGTSGFQYKEWKGTFYPEELAVAKMLSYYAARFPTTESNYTFRQIPSAATLQRWVELTPEHFRFSLKAPQRITHFAKLKNCAETLHYFCETARQLGPKLGPILFQLPPNFTADMSLLETFLREVPEGMRVAFEFRHVSWFREDIYAVLRAANAALCIAHSDDLLTPIMATADFTYLRLRKAQYGRKQFAQWAEVIAECPEWRDVFIYFKHEDTGTGPDFAQKQIAVLAKRGLALAGK